MTPESDIIEAYDRARADGRTHSQALDDMVELTGGSHIGMKIILNRHGRIDYLGAPVRMVSTQVQPRVKRSHKGRELRASGGRHARFVAPKPPKSGTVRGLSPDNPAVVEGRTQFPTMVAGPFESPRMLVSGRNSPKTGAKVEKGKWAGMPIYTLTLEERKTCAPQCPVYTLCYGNGMPYGRRNDAFHEDFIAALAAEVVTVARQHVGGFVVRLHILGDFFSVKYVEVWRKLLEMLPMLNVFGYTGRREDFDDGLSPDIARAITKLNEDFPERWVVRTSHTEPGPMRAIVVTKDPELPGVQVCPAQTDETACCGTCTLCWAPAFRDKTIAFLLHGKT